MSARVLWFLPLVALFLLSACDLPRDPDGTSARVSDGEMTIGRIAGQQPDEAERRALQQIIAVFSTEPRYIDDDAHHLFAGLEAGTIDLVVGGIPQDTLFKTKASLSKPVGTTRIGDETRKTVFAVRRGENAFLKTINGQIAATKP